MTLSIEQKMHNFTATIRSTHRPLLVMLALSGVFAAQAQPNSNSPNQFGDRQAGQWGDPGQGSFGNPAAGQFDNSQLKVPPPGTRPLGRVYDGKVPADSPYLSLPTPADAAPIGEPAKTPAAKGSTGKKTKKSRKSAKPDPAN